jgi:hypothetical protein
MRSQWLSLLGVALIACAASTSASPSPASAPTSAQSGGTPVASAPATVPGSGLPSLDALSSTLVLPTDFAPTLSYVSPDGYFVAARARDYGRVTLYRITAPSPRAALMQLTQVAEVRGFADQVAWLEDSSAVLVGSDLEPGHSLANHDSTGAGRRIVIINTDGRVVVAPAAAHEVIYHRARVSPDGRWIPVSDACCVQQVLLLSRDGAEVRRVAGPAQVATRTLGFVGWDRDGLTLFWDNTADGPSLVAAGLDGVERYRIAAPASYPVASWGVVASAPDRSWQLIELSGGMGSSFRAYGLLAGHDLRPLPDAVTSSGYGPFAAGDELLYVDPSGALRAYKPSAESTRDLSLRLDMTRAPAIVGVSDGYFVWRELVTGYVSDLKTGRKLVLPIQKGLSVSIVEGARLADYHFDDNTIVIFNLAGAAAR